MKNLGGQVSEGGSDGIEREKVRDRLIVGLGMSGLFGCLSG